MALSYLTNLKGAPMKTPCDYILFGERHHQGSLRDTLRHVLPELERRNPDGLRELADSGGPGCIRLMRNRPKPSYRDFLKLAPDLWANVRRAKQENLESSCRDVLERLGYPRHEFKVERPFDR